MIRHWTRHLRTEQRPGRAAPDEAQPRHQRRRRRHDRRRSWSSCCSPSSSHGAWIAIAGDGRALRAHAAASAGTTTGSRDELAVDEDDDDRCCPRGCTRSCWSPRSTSRRCGRWPTPGPPGPRSSRRSPSTSTRTRPRRCRPSGTAATSRCRSRSSTRRTARSPARSSTTSKPSARGNPRDVVIVYIPEYVVGHWWEQVLHNQSALRLKGRLLFTPGVMVASVPWQLRVRRGRRGPARRPRRPGRSRRGQ